MNTPLCANCKYGTVTLHSFGDRCTSASNTQGFPPYALRHDETLCGASGAWFEAKAAPDDVYKAVDALGIGANP